jgi:hypothetical protein
VAPPPVAAAARAEPVAVAEETAASAPEPAAAGPGNEDDSSAPSLALAPAPSAAAPAERALPTQRPIPGGPGSLWRAEPSAAAAADPAEAEPTRDEPPARQPAVVHGRWTGYVTDDACREKGAVSDHGQCLESCLRRGHRPLIAIDGQLYALVGLERIRGQNDRKVVVEGQIDPARRIVTVSAGWPAK